MNARKRHADILEKGTRASRNPEESTSLVGNGETVALPGPSGPGDLFRAVLASRSAQQAEHRIAGPDFANSMKMVRLLADGRIGIIPGVSPAPDDTALENVAVPLELGMEALFERVRAELLLVELAERDRHYPAQLRAANSSAWQWPGHCRCARKLFADEPTGNLDAKTGGQRITDRAVRAQTDTGATLFIITHDPALAARCGRHCRNGDGRIISTGPPHEERFRLPCGSWGRKGATAAVRLPLSAVGLLAEPKPDQPRS
ncbi:MAG: ABC transporter [Sphingomonadales bacterium]|nr:ABC transporter [Sphingomonadales bacterium]